jgi:hypothetical protein
MNTLTHTQRIISTSAAAGLLARTTLVLAPAASQASRLPADPVVTFAAPAPASQPVSNGHAASMRAVLEDLRGSDSVSPHC